MALYNEILVARLNNGLRRLLGMKGDAPAPQLSGDIVAGIILENDRPELKYLSGVRLASAVASASNAAAKRSKVALVNPTGSGVLVVVQGAQGTATTVAAQPGIRIGDTLAAAVQVTASVGSRDARWNAGALAQPPSAQIWTDIGDTAGGTLITEVIIDFLSATITYWHYDKALILPPGWNLTVEPGVDNAPVSAAFDWYERAIESSET